MRGHSAVSCALSKVAPTSVQAVILAALKVCIIPTDVVSISVLFQAADAS